MKGYYIGMDGGGTGTAVLVTDGDRELCRIQMPGLNYNSIGPEGVAESLRQVQKELEDKDFFPKECAAVGIGSAGISNPDAQSFMRAVLAELGYSCPIAIFGDQEAAMYGAFGSRDGILLISGTGSICLGQTGHGETEFRVGGCGHLIDDGGSAYALGRDMLTAIVKAKDGRAEPTALRDPVFERLGISSIPQLIGYVYAKERTKKETADLASLLSDPDVKKDGAAQRIMEKAAEELAELVETVLRKMREAGVEGEIPLVLHGSVLQKNDVIREKLLELLMMKSRDGRKGQTDREGSPGLRLAAAQKDAAWGAAGLAQRAAERSAAARETISR